MKIPRPIKTIGNSTPAIRGAPLCLFHRGKVQYLRFLDGLWLRENTTFLSIIFDAKAATDKVGCIAVTLVVPSGYLTVSVPHRL